MDNCKIDPISFSEAVCKRPKMWTATGCLEEVMALFDGYKVAISHYDLMPDGKPSPADALEWFCQQSSEQYPAQQIKKLRLIYDSDEEIFQALLEYLKNMRLEQNNKTEQKNPSY